MGFADEAPSKREIGLGGGSPKATKYTICSSVLHNFTYKANFNLCRKLLFHESDLTKS